MPKGHVDGRSDEPWSQTEPSRLGSALSSVLQELCRASSSVLRRLRSCRIEQVSLPVREFSTSQTQLRIQASTLCGQLNGKLPSAVAKFALGILLLVPLILLVPWSEKFS